MINIVTRKEHGLSRWREEIGSNKTEKNLSAKSQNE